MTEMVVMTRPASWDHSNIVLSGWGLRRRVIVFAHVAHQLRKDEIVALAAHEAAHVRHFHGVLRLLINVAVSYIFCWLAGWGATHVQFFEGFNYSPMLTLDMPGTHAGSVCAVALVVFPMLLYPLSPLLNLAARLMQYDADLHAARIAGLDPMISALVKLHKDTTTSLSPSLVYSLFHYKRPHPGMRVANLQRLKRLSAAGSSTSFRSPPSPERPKRTKLPHQQPFFAAHVRSRTSATVPWPKLRPASTVRPPKLPPPSSQAASPQATAATTS